MWWTQQNKVSHTISCILVKEGEGTRTVLGNAPEISSMLDCSGLSKNLSDSRMWHYGGEANVRCSLGTICEAKGTGADVVTDQEYSVILYGSAMVSISARWWSTLNDAHVIIEEDGDAGRVWALRRRGVLAIPVEQWLITKCRTRFLSHLSGESVC